MDLEATTQCWRTALTGARAAALAVVMGIAPGSQLLAGTMPPAQLPLSTEGQPFENFGSAVAIDGDTAVVSTPYAAVGAVEGAGSAYVYVREGAIWALQAQLSALDPKPFSNYGRAVAIDGDTVVVGAYSADGIVPSSGAAYVYTRSGNAWTQQAKLQASDGEGFSDFGLAVALSGDSVVVGSPSLFINGENVVGAAYVYARAGQLWSQQQKLIASDGLAFDSFGNAVAIDGDTAIIAASQASVGAASFCGAVYAFGRSGGSWSQLQKLSAADASTEDTFGHSIALRGTQLIVGAPQPRLLFGGGPGAAYIFDFAGGSWTQQARLVADDGVTAAGFGTAVGIEGDLAVVGAPNAGAQAGVNLQAGAVYAYIRSQGSWAQQSRIRALAISQGAHLGARLGMSGATALAGAPDANVGSNASQGQAWLFRLGTPVLAVTPAAIDFTDVPLGATRSRSLTVRNIGTADLFSGNLLVVGSDAAHYTVNGESCNGLRIPPAASCQAQVSYAPQALGAHSAQIVAPGSAGVAFVPLNGQGVPTPPQIAVTPNPVSQSLDPAQTATQVLSIAHPGNNQTLNWSLTQSSRTASTRLRVLGDATVLPSSRAPQRAGTGSQFVASGARGAVASPAGLPPVGQVLSHSTSQTIASGTSIACFNNDTGTTNANQFLRTFTLADFGISNSLTVSSIRFGMEASSVAMPVTVNLYTVSGELRYLNMQLLATTVVNLPAQALSLVDVPISASVPAGSTLVLEVAMPDLESANGQYLPGSNAAGQTAPSYIASPRCGSGEPADVASLGFPDMHLVMSVSGETTAPPVQCAIPAWLNLATQSGALTPGTSQPVNLQFNSTGLANGTYRANLCFASNAEDALYPVPVTLTVPGTPPVDPVFADGFE